MKKHCVYFCRFIKLYVTDILSDGKLILKGSGKYTRMHEVNKRSFHQKFVSSLSAMLFLFVLLFLAGCASSERMMRLSPAGARSYSAPDAKRLKSVSFRKMPQHKVKNKTLAEENVVNVWPFFLKNDYFHAIMWPFIDYDRYGMAVRPFYNLEGDDHSILFPLAGWNSADNSGWVLNTFWSKNRFSVFPFYHHKPNYLYAFPIIRETYNDEEKTLKSFCVIPFSMYEKYAKDGSEYVFFVLPFGGWYKGKNYTSGMILNTYWGKDSLGVFPLFHHDEDFYCYLLYWRDKKEQSGGIFPFFYYSPEAWYALLVYNNDTRWGIFPLFAQNHANDGGYLFPFYIYRNDANDGFINLLLLFNYYHSSNKKYLNLAKKENLLVFPFSKSTSEKFELTPGSINPFLWQNLDEVCIKLRSAYQGSDMRNLIANKRAFGNILKAMKLDKDFAVPSDIAGLDDFVSKMRERFGVNLVEKKNSVFPLYNYSEKANEESFGILLSLLYFQNSWRSNDTRLKYENKQKVEEDINSVAVLFRSRDQLMRKWYDTIEYDEKACWMRLSHQLEQLAYSIALDEYAAIVGQKDYQSKTAEIRAKLTANANSLGLPLPELKTAAQCYIFNRELASYCMEYYKNKSFSALLFEKESGDRRNSLEFFPLFLHDKEKLNDNRIRERFNLLLLCHNQTTRERMPHGKIGAAYTALMHLKSNLTTYRKAEAVKALEIALKEANVPARVPQNYRECNELRKKLLELSPENISRVSAFLPLYYYSSDNVPGTSYLNILGILYNQSVTEDDYWFNVLGFLSRGFKEGEEEEFRILEFLYRSRKRKNEKDYLIFPFFYFRESENSSQFSFLHRIVNIEKSTKGTKGHIFYIPFGD